MRRPLERVYDRRARVRQRALLLREVLSPSPQPSFVERVMVQLLGVIAVFSALSLVAMLLRACEP